MDIIIANCPNCSKNFDLIDQNETCDCGEALLDDGIWFSGSTSEQDLVKQLYDERATEFGENSFAVGYRYPLQQRRIVSLIRKCILNDLDSDPVNILEIGVGNGNLMLNLARQLPYKLTAYGIDISILQLKQIPLSDNKIIQVVGSGDNLPFADNQFDIVFCSEVIQHIDDPSGIFKEMNRVVKQNGKCVVSTLNSDSLLRKLYRIFDRKNAAKRSTKNENSEMIRRNTKQMLDFVPKGQQPILTYLLSPLPLTTKNKLVGKKGGANIAVSW